MNEVGVMPLSAKLKKGVTQTQQTGHCQAPNGKPGLFIQAGFFIGRLWQ